MKYIIRTAAMLLCLYFRLAEVILPLCINVLINFHLNQQDKIWPDSCYLCAEEPYF